MEEREYEHCVAEKVDQPPGPIADHTAHIEAQANDKQDIPADQAAPDPHGAVVDALEWHQYRPQAVVDIVITQQDQPMKEREAKPEQARVLMQVKRDMLFFLISVERSSSPHGC